jgi:hypothetical protein
MAVGKIVGRRLTALAALLKGELIVGHGVLRLLAIIGLHRW